MTAYSQSRAFLAQLVLAEQRQLHEIWLSRLHAGQCAPLRSAFAPSDFPRLLPDISIIEASAGNDYRVRLAGTRVRDIHDREITGLELAEFESGEALDYWRAVYGELVATAQPAQGIIRAPRASKEHLVQFWLRLPLSVNGDRVDLVLCHDMCLPVAEVDDDLACGSAIQA